MLVVLFFGFVAQAEDERSPAAVEARDEEVSARAKHRLYVGGADESDVKVQTPLPTPVRKMAPTLDESETNVGDD